MPLGFRWSLAWRMLELEKGVQYTLTQHFPKSGDFTDWSDEIPPCIFTNRMVNSIDKMVFQFPLVLL